MVIVVSDFRGVSLCCLAQYPMCSGRGHETGEFHLWCTGSRGRLQGKMPLMAFNTSSYVLPLKFLELSPVVPSVVYATALSGGAFSPSTPSVSYVSQVQRQAWGLEEALGWLQEVGVH